jgi:crotonobetainyl-CoA:carnitine CoA-transferase CaiB-like acyl-CoA transferase
VCIALSTRVQSEKTSQKLPPNPIWNWYRTSDDRIILLVMPAAMPYWPKFCTMIGRPDWITDERFTTLTGLMTNNAAIIPEVAAMFASQSLEYWREKLDGAGLIWEPVATLPEVCDDPALRERDAFSHVVHERAGALEIISAPFHIRDADVEVRGPAPDAGQHTREVFAQAGLDAAEIDRLFDKGVLS